MEPSTVPPRATASSCVQVVWSANPSIHAAGIVNARPPATMEPADMTVCVTLASLRSACPLLRALRKKSETMAANTIGQGRAPILSAVYADAAVMTTQPTTPMAMPRAVSCPLGRFI